MAALFASGHAADIVLLAMAIETIVLARFSRLRLGTIVLAALPGALIVCGLRAALTGASWIWIALPLLASWPAHLWDVRARLRSSPRT